MSAKTDSVAVLSLGFDSGFQARVSKPTPSPIPAGGEHVADEATAADFDSLVSCLPYLYSGHPDRLKRLQNHARKEAAARRRPRFLFMREPHDRWLIGLVGAHPQRFYYDNAGRRGLAIAHHVISSSKPVPYACPALQACASGAMTQKAIDNALRAAAHWVATATGCLPVATAIERIVAREDALVFAPEHGDPDIITT